MLLLFWPIISALFQFISALFAILCFVVIGRVSLWWMMTTAPVVVYRTGFNVFSGLYWRDSKGWHGIGTPGFLTSLAIQIVVVTICWWWIRNLRRRALRQSIAHMRSNRIG